MLKVGMYVKLSKSAWADEVVKKYVGKPLTIRELGNNPLKEDKNIPCAYLELNGKLIKWKFRGEMTPIYFSQDALELMSATEIAKHRCEIGE